MKKLPGIVLMFIIILSFSSCDWLNMLFNPITEADVQEVYDGAVRGIETLEYVGLITAILAGSSETGITSLTGNVSAAYSTGHISSSTSIAAVTFTNYVDTESGYTYNGVITQATTIFLPFSMTFERTGGLTLSGGKIKEIELDLTEVLSLISLSSTTTGTATVNGITFNVEDFE